MMAFTCVVEGKLFFCQGYDLQVCDTHHISEEHNLDIHSSSQGPQILRISLLCFVTLQEKIIISATIIGEIL
jgi:hypothetical protein